ncbi:MAG: SH3 domain-containing protein [Acidobacteriota bacterium]|nr:SH3 domain-containing protein [Acidobacteriota bacterium]
MRRDRTGPLLLYSFLAAAAGLVWLAYHPDWPPLRRAAELPVVGPLVAAFRDRYTPPSPAASPAAGEEEAAVEIVVEPAAHPDAEPWIWVPAGTELRDEPGAAGSVVGTLEALTNLRWSERRGDWYRVARRASRGEGALEGWVLADDPAVSRPTLPATTVPPGPLAARPIDPAVLATARALMGAGAGEGSCGPYRLLTDVREEALGALCEEVVARVDAAYGERFRRRPVGEAAETVLVFAGREAFSAFAGATSRWRVEATGRASAADGYVALAWEGRDRGEVATTLVHELAHLVNRRALGPALPAWLDEGMADELADRLLGGKYEAALWRVGMDRAAGDLLPLAELVDLGSAGFYGPRGYANYAQALVALRFFSQHPELAPGFGRFLEALAAGAAYSPAVLPAHLGRSWEELQAAWDAWAAGRFQELPPFAPAAAVGR